MEIQEPKIGATLVGDPAVGKRGGLNVKLALMGVLFEVVSFEVHGKNVHDPIAIGKEIDSSVPEHGIVGSTGPIPGEQYRFFASIVAPDVLGRAAFVTLGLAGLAIETSEEQGLTVGAIGAFGSLGQRDNFALSAVVDGDKLGLGQSRVSPGFH